MIKQNWNKQILKQENTHKKQALCIVKKNIEIILFSSTNKEN